MVAIGDDDSIDGGDIKEHLKDYLGSGSFATLGTLSDAAKPGILVESLGTIGLPLSERDASELCQRCYEAPLGKGTQSFVDRTVGKTWKLSPAHFRLRNPAWQSTLHDVTGKVAEELGLLERAEIICAETQDAPERAWGVL